MRVQFVTKNPSRIFKKLFTGIGKIVNIFSLYAPLIHQLKLARLISAGFLRAFAAAPTSTDMTFLCTECISHVHQHPPRPLHPGFPWRCFPAPDLCFHQIPLSEISSQLCPPPPLPSKPAPRTSLEWRNLLRGHRGSTSADGGGSKPLPRFRLARQMSHGRRSKLKLFVPRDSTG